MKIVILSRNANLYSTRRLVEAAQQRGSVRRDKPAAEILARVLTLANMWQHHTEDVNSLVPPAQQRTAITDAVRRLAAPDRPADR